MKINIKKLHENAILPTRGSEKAAGYDLYARLEEENLMISPHTTVMVGTGVAMSIPDGYFGAVYARSGIARKKSLRPANCVGVIDSDYRGEVIVALHNDSNSSQYIENGERIAQIVIQPYLSVEFIESSELDDTQRGAGGFGSTGTH